MRFVVEKTDGKARACVFSLPRGTVQTPVFMPVGTAAAVKALSVRDLLSLNIQIILSNTYHLHIKPGEDLIRKAGGLQKFMGWPGLTLTDSGGFQVFSLPNRRIEDGGVRFSVSAGGDERFLTPESVIQIQRDLGSDICMVLDECLPWPCSHRQAQDGVRRTLKWAARSRTQSLHPHQFMFGIVQGSIYPDLRQTCLRGLKDLDFDGYAIGGVSVGEGSGILVKTVKQVMPHLPPDKPRYVMGVGMPLEILNCIEQGVDFFDCVIPTRYARSGVLFTDRGRIRISQRAYRRDFYPIEPNMTSFPVDVSRAYLHHLFLSNEILGTVLASLHNIAWYHRLVGNARKAILENRYSSFKQSFAREFTSSD